MIAASSCKFYSTIWILVGILDLTSPVTYLTIADWWEIRRRDEAKYLSISITSSSKTAKFNSLFISRGRWDSYVLSFKYIRVWYWEKQNTTNSPQGIVPRLHIRVKKRDVFTTRKQIGHRPTNHRINIMIHEQTRVWAYFVGGSLEGSIIQPLCVESKTEGSFDTRAQSLSVSYTKRMRYWRSRDVDCIHTESQYTSIVDLGLNEGSRIEVATIGQFSAHAYQYRWRDAHVLAPTSRATPGEVALVS